MPDLRDDDAWRRAQRGQFLLVSAALGVIAGGLGIATIGVTAVFVPSDLTFLQATRDQLDAIDPQLISLMAHDRAGFGGALASAGAALLLVALRGVKRGDHRLWWTLAVAGLPGFAATIVIHAGVGYTDFMHLAPVLVAAVLLQRRTGLPLSIHEGPAVGPGYHGRCKRRGGVSSRMSGVLPRRGASGRTRSGAGSSP